MDVARHEAQLATPPLIVFVAFADSWQDVGWDQSKRQYGTKATGCILTHVR